MCLWAIYILPWSVCCRMNRSGKYKSLTDTWMWKLGLKPRNSRKRNTLMGFSLHCGNLGWQKCHKMKKKNADNMYAILTGIRCTRKDSIRPREISRHRGSIAYRELGQHGVLPGRCALYFDDGGPFTCSYCFYSILWYENKYVHNRTYCTS
jgi:hypothetical protein